MKKKLEEKQTEILLQIIDEEIESACDDLLLEYDFDYGAGDSGWSDGAHSGGSGGFTRFWRDTKNLPGFLLSPVFQTAAAFKKFAAKMGIAIRGLIGMTIQGAIQALLPFNDPRAVTYIGKKILAWESESMKKIDQQFAKETAEMRQGWETFRNDFWGIGFVAAPFGAIAAASAAGRGIDAALSIGNVITGGRLQGAIRRLSETKDPGTLEAYLKKEDNKQSDEMLEEGLFDFLKKRKKEETNQTTEPKTANEKAKKPADISKLVDDALNGPPDETSLAAAIKQMEQKFGKEKSNQILKMIVDNLVQNPKAKALEKVWIEKNLPTVLEPFKNLNKEAVTNQIPGITLEQAKDYASKAGQIAVQSVQKAAAKKGVGDIPAESKAIIENIVQSDPNLSAIKSVEIPKPTTQIQQPVAASAQAPASSTVPAAQPQTAPVAPAPVATPRR